MKAELIDIKLVKIHPELDEHFKRDETTVENLRKSMEKRGFDKKHPLIIWEETGYLVDGHTRREAARRAGISYAPAIFESFASIEDVKAYMDRTQYHRRNLSQRDRVELLQRDAAYEAAKNKKQYIVDHMGISPASAARIMAILRDPEKLRALMAGEAISSGKRAKKKEDIQDPSEGEKSPVEALSEALRAYQEATGEKLTPRKIKELLR